MSEHANDIQGEVKRYVAVFATLAFLTVVTVAVSYLHLSLSMAVMVALAVASVKGTLVALIFMHLNHEKSVIYQLLALTAVFAFALMTLPQVWIGSLVTAEQSVWTQNVPASHASDGEHGGDAHH